MTARLEDLRVIHLVGVGGAGMSGLAKLLHQQGHTVSGSDLKPNRAMQALQLLGVDTWVGHQPDRARDWDLVVASSAVPPGDPELRAAREAGVELWERPRLLEEMTRRMPALGVTGTHGKTTGTAMLVTALRALGRDPSFMVGGELVALNTNAHLGEPDLFALEADEAFGTFLGLTFGGLVVTNVEADHLDHYGTLDALEAAFATVASGVAGPVVGCVDDPGVLRLANSVAGMVGYGTSDEAHWRIGDISHGRLAVGFTLHRGSEAWRVDVPKPGDHVARNAAGVLALLGELGLDVAAAAAGLRRFAGVRRRFDIRAERSGVVVVDDYAHHPTEIAATIDAARRGTTGRLLVAFQPHRYTRTAEHVSGFADGLCAADVAVVTDIYAAGEHPLPGVSGRLVAEATSAAGGDVRYVPRRADVAAALLDMAAPGDTILLLGAGDITSVAEELAAGLAAR